MATLTFDTYDFINSLEKSGFSEKQAKALTDGLRNINLEHVSTKEDIMQLRNEISDLKAEIFKWILPIMLGQAGLIAALVKIIN